jgi:hypothetical protein
MARAAAQLRRQKEFRKAHPTIAKRRDLEASTGLKMPRRPASTMSVFVKSNYARVQSELSAGGAKPKPTDIMKAIAAQFKALPSEEKSKLEQEAKTQKEAYERKKAEVEAAGPPKRPATAYIVSHMHAQLYTPFSLVYSRLVSTCR